MLLSALLLLLLLLLLLVVLVGGFAAVFVAAAAAAFAASSSLGVCTPQGMPHAASFISIGFLTLSFGVFVCLPSLFAASFGGSVYRLRER